MRKLGLLLALSMPASVALGQQAPGNTAPPILQKPYETLRDFFNYYATAGVDYDSNGQYILGGLQPGSATGVALGGGASGVHNWATSTLSLSYRGTYRDYFNNFGHANEQSLVAVYQKNFKRWAVNVAESAGILHEQGAVYGTEGPSIDNPSLLVQTNPYSTEVRYESTQVGATYMQSYRLSYTFSGAYMLSHYNYGQAIGFSDTFGSFGANYRITRRTTLSGTYSHGVYTYQHNFGSNQVDSAYATLAHNFADHIALSASLGGTRASGDGAVIFPIQAVNSSGQTETIFAQVRYHSTNYLPYFALTLSKQWQHTDLYFTGSEAVTPGNGQFLTSRTLGFTGLFNRQLRRSDLSFGAFYSHIAGIVTPAGVGAGKTRGFDASYSYNLMRHVGFNARYDYLYYNEYVGVGAKPDNHVTVGIYFESKDIPLGLY